AYGYRGQPNNCEVPGFADGVSGYNARSVMCFTHREPMLRYRAPPGRIGALEGGAHVSTEARVFSRHHARGAFDAHEGCAKASKHCNCDNRTSDFPKDDAGSVLRRRLRRYAEVDHSISAACALRNNRFRLKLLDERASRS